MAAVLACGFLCLAPTVPGQQTAATVYRGSVGGSHFQMRLNIQGSNVSGAYSYDSIGEDIKLTRVWCAADAGLVINPDGARNQLEGGIVQAVSWTLKEQVRLDENGIASRDWDSYPILRFSEVPDMQVELVDGAGNPSLGVGECTVGPTAAAIGNAVAHALGVRIHDMPLTRDRIMAALLKT